MPVYNDRPMSRKLSVDGIVPVVDNVVTLGIIINKDISVDHLLHYIHYLIFCIHIITGIARSRTQ